MMNGKMRALIVVAMGVAVLGGSHVWAGPTYTGSLASDYNSGNSQGADGLIQGNNGWVVQEDPLVLSWEVSFDGSLWHYQYTFNELGLQGAVSHMILEVSSIFDASDILNSTHPIEPGDPQWYLASDPGNPDMPNVIWGLKFDTGGLEDILVLSFDSPLPPVWGDIYMKDGTPGGAAWNAGFTLPDTDPLSPAANGSVNSHVLVPDSTPIVPTPGAVVLAAAGSMLIAWLRRRGALA